MRAFGWSFYSQGAAEGRQAAADQFIAAALACFDDPDPNQGSPWDKAERLAWLIKRQRTLLILDGVEPLQNPPPVEQGRIKDPGLCCLLRELASSQPGLCLVTTRLPLDDLKEFTGSAHVQIDLEQLAPEDGAAYLAHLGVRGSPAELREASEESGGHALALTLLGGLLSDGRTMATCAAAKRLASWPMMPEAARHAVRVMAVVRTMVPAKDRSGHPAHHGPLRPARRWRRHRNAARRRRPSRASPTPCSWPRRRKGMCGLPRPSPPTPLSDPDWNRAVANLRRGRLLAERDPQEPDTLDAHPLVREHFGEQLRREVPAAWQEAHGRLYEHYKSVAKEFPDTIEEMAPLYAAVAHGCRAGRHQETLEEVYLRRIKRSNEHYSWKKLGAFGADLAALSGFFDPPWRRPADGLREASKGFVLNEAGSALLALGRPAEAIEPMRAELGCLQCTERPAPIRYDCQ